MSPSRSGSAGVVLALGLVLGALTWAAWLGWDRTASYDAITGTVQDPYVTLQVLGCALTVGVVTAVLAGRGRPVAAAAGMGLGFWLAWTVHAATNDASGLYVIGSVILALGLAGGTVLAALLGAAVRTAMDASRRRRAASNAPEAGGT